MLWRTFRSSVSVALQMNTKSPKIRAEVENRARKEKSNKGKNINSKLNGVSAGKTGFVSQQKLIQISGKSEKVLWVLKQTVCQN